MYFYTRIIIITHIWWKECVMCELFQTQIYLWVSRVVCMVFVCMSVSAVPTMMNTFTLFLWSSSTPARHTCCHCHHEHAYIMIIIISSNSRQQQLHIHRSNDYRRRKVEIQHQAMMAQWTKKTHKHTHKWQEFLSNIANSIRVIVNIQSFTTHTNTPKDDDSDDADDHLTLDLCSPKSFILLFWYLSFGFYFSSKWEWKKPKNTRIIMM